MAGPASFAVLCSCILAAALAQAPLQVSIKANWNSAVHAPLQEASEFLAQQDGALFWSFVDKVNNRPVDVVGDTPNCAVDLASSLLPPASSAMLNLTLTLRAMSAAVELHTQLSSGSRNHCSGADAWAVVCTSADAAFVACTPSQIGAAPGTEAIACPAELEFDHVHPASPAQAPLLVVYGELGTDQFKEFHAAATAAAVAGSHRYIVRHSFNAAEGLPTALRGYGVWMDIKNMEYKAIDDRNLSPQESAAADGSTADVPVDEEAVAGILFGVLHQRKPELASQLKALKTELLSHESSAALSAWEIKDLGIQATMYVTNGSPDGALERLIQVTGNLPNMARFLSRQPVTEAKRQEFMSMQGLLGVGNNVVLVNGIALSVNAPTFNIFSLLGTLARETAIQADMDNLALPDYTLEQLRQSAYSGQISPNSIVFRVNVRKGAKGVISYINDLEKDRQYYRWPTTIHTILQPTWQLHGVRKNLYNLIAIIDPSTIDDLAFVSRAAYYIQVNAPMRFGVIVTGTSLVNSAAVPNIVNDASKDDLPARSEHIAMLYHHVVDEHGVASGWSFLLGLAQVGQMLAQTARPGATVALTMKMVKEAFVSSVKTATGAWTSSSAQAEIQKVFKDEDGSVSAKVLATAAWVRTRGLSVGSMLVNGRVQPTHNLQVVMPVISEEMQMLQRLVQSGQLTDKDHVLTKLLEQPGTVNAYHETILGAETFTSLLSVEATAAASHAAFAHLAGSSSVRKPVSVLVIADFGTIDGLQQLANAVHVITEVSDSSKVARVGALNVGGSPIAHFVQAAWNFLVKRAPSDALPNVLYRLATTARAGVESDWSVQNLQNALVDEVRPLISSQKAVLNKLADAALLKLNHNATASATAFLAAAHAGNSAVVVNGRVLSASPVLSSDAVELAIQREHLQRAELVNKVIPPLDVADESQIVAQASAVIGQLGTTDRGALPHPDSVAPSSKLVIQGDPKSKLSIVASLDPLSVSGQRWAPVLALLHDVLHVPITIFFSPTFDLSALPLKSFYRYVGSSKGAVFKNLPDHVFTMKIDEPEPWIVQATTAPYDLDNIRMSTVQQRVGVVAVEYTLKRLLAAGQCEDLTHLQPPNGLQLELVRVDSGVAAPATADTLVMQNLGYFQFQANPGVWILRLAPGRAVQLYNIIANSASADGGLRYGMNVLTSAQRGNDDIVAFRPVLVRDFSGPIVQLSVKKKPGKEGEALLAAPGTEGAAAAGDGAAGEQPVAEQTGFWSRVSNLFGGSKPADKAAANVATVTDETIHVFSLASGHVYERFLKIMMVSVTKRTSSPVKFWLVENFLSPQFKEAVPKLARAFGFQVELVTYKWPSWLRHQTEKQRIIWGYKILFLDVLFPLNLTKIIYVDADQVVRADLKELWTMDLHGAPYAYTPFCTSRQETLGFQFWRSGYWHDHLRGLPYHISALYVVDLVRFRQMAAGDSLRAIYDNLSRDPNSLSNLDQDLPNYAQHSIPIHSLPTEWLWCESWCSDDSKPDAKTIDLCNNPQHKEPKLDMARRVISGDLFPESWVELDELVHATESGQTTPVVDTPVAQERPDL